MRENNKIANAINEWLEMSRAALEDQIVTENSDVTFIMQRTETLLTLSKSLRTLSKRTRQHAEAARDSVRNGTGHHGNCSSI